MSVLKKVKSFFNNEEKSSISLDFMRESSINTKVLYVAHRPGCGLRGDREIIRCDEYREVAQKLGDTISKLAALKRDYIKKKSLAKGDDSEYLRRVREDYINLKSPINEDLRRLENKRRQLKDKYNILHRYNDRVYFHKLLIDELYQVIPNTVFTECCEKAKVKFESLKEN